MGALVGHANRPLARGLFLTATLIALAGCGIKGDPIPPDSPSNPAANQNVFDQDAADDDDESAAFEEDLDVIENDDLVQGTRVSRNPRADDRGFFLDPLLN